MFYSFFRSRRMCLLLLVWLIAAAVCISAQDDGGPIYFPDEDILQTGQDLKPMPPTTLSPKVKQGSSGKSLQMCRKYAETVFQKIKGIDEQEYSYDTCTRSLEPLIVNGTVAKPREFPHMALIGVQSRFRGVQWKCGGTLISERYVLSAAHCNPLNPKRVRLGDYNIQSKEDDDTREAKSVEFNIIEVIQHPEYDGDKNYNDITLYKLDRDVVFDEYVRPICLHTEYEVPREYGIISGWGSTEFAGPFSDILLKGNVSFVPGSECGKALNPTLQQTKQSQVRDDMMICAANFVNGTDTCQGDSGGPLQYLLSDPYCMYSQVGITSFGVKCGYDAGQPKYPAVYTRVSNYVPWIESIVWP